MLKQSSPDRLVEIAAARMLERPITDATRLGKKHRTIGELARRLCAGNMQPQAGLTKPSTTVGELKNMVPHCSVPDIDASISGEIATLWKRLQRERMEAEIGTALQVAKLQELVPEGIPANFRNSFTISWMGIILQHGLMEDSIRVGSYNRWAKNADIMKDFKRLARAWKERIDVRFESQEDRVRITYLIWGALQ